MAQTSLSDQTLAIYLALAAALIFALSSLVFAEYAKRVSVLWMNCFKAVLCTIALLITIPFFTGFHWPHEKSMLGFFVSGLIGLNIADIFLLTAFTRLGAARTLILFGFQPLLIGLGAAYFFSQPITSTKLLAVVFLFACLFTFSLEKFRREGHWELRGLAFALIGVTLDAGGILLTRASFEWSPHLAPMEGQFWRCLGALAGFVVIATFHPFRLLEGLMRWPLRSRAVIIAASLGGTFVSLLLFLTAIKIGHLASLSAIAVTGPMFATTFECIYQRRWPSRFLIAAFAFFAVGFFLLINDSI